MSRFMVGGIGLFLLLGNGRAESIKPMDPVVVLTIQPEKKPIPRDLLYPLLPESLDQRQGNAAPRWLRVAQMLPEMQAAKEYEKIAAWAHEIPSERLPREDVRVALETKKFALRMADEAASFEHCEWELPVLTVQNLTQMPMAELSSFRRLATYLALRARWELQEGRLDQAVASLRTGFVLGRHLSEGDTMVHQLVGIAITSMMLQRLEECMASPGAPNFYWSLTGLPRPFVNSTRAVRHELSTILRSFPQLRELAREDLSKEQVNRLLDDLIQVALSLDGGKTSKPAWARLLATSTVVAMNFAEAKEGLLARGWAKERLEKMPPQQVVALHFLDQYNRSRDDILKFWSLPVWESRKGLAEVERKIHEQPPQPTNILAMWNRLLLPAFFKIRGAEIRLDRQIAALRCVEAVRLQAAKNGGKLPARLADVNVVPLPIDPATGKGFDAFYKLEEDKGFLRLPALEETSAGARVYEIRPGTK